MRAAGLLLFSLLFAFAGPVRAEIGATDVPGDADWYLHADLDAMRSESSGSGLYDWLQGEVFLDIKNDLGIDLGEEVDSVTAFADAALGTVIVVEGPISGETRDKVLALAATKSKLDTKTYDGKTYYHALDGSDSRHHGKSFDDFEESAYFTFAVDDKLIVASDERQMEALLDTGGHISGAESHDGSLFVLTADKEFVQAGVKTAEFADDENDWDSNILRNTEKAALLVSDQDGLIAIEAQLVSKDPAIARSLGGIINGLISLQAFNAELDPQIVRMIQNTNIEVLDNVLSINTVLDPAIVVRLLDEEQ